MDGTTLQSRRIGTLISLLFFLSVPAFSSEYRIEWARIGGYATSYLQPESANSFSGLVLWSPARPIGDKITLLTDIGLTYLNTPDSKFFAIYLSPRFQYRFSKPFSSDLSVGTQNWTTEGGFLPMAGIGFNYHFEESPLLWVKTIRLAGNRIWKTDFPTWQILLGVEFELEKIETSNLEPSPTPLATTLPSVAPELQASPAPELQKTEEGIKLTLSSKRISFASGKADLPSSALEYLTAIGKAFAANKDEWSELTISGHTDDRGKPSQNESLSLARAQSVVQLFSSLGVVPEKIHVRGAGAKEPLSSNRTAEGRAANRRVEILVKADSVISKKLITEIEKINQASSESNP